MTLNLDEVALDYAEKRSKQFGSCWNEQDVLNAKICFEDGYTRAVDDILAFLDTTMDESGDYKCGYMGESCVQEIENKFLRGEK